MGNPHAPFLKEIIKAIRRVSNAHKAIGCVVSPKKRRGLAFENENMQSCTDIPKDVPKGHCAVYVGSERRRFIIPTTYLHHSLFRALLEKAEEEYGFEYQMGLTIPCEEVVFRHLTTMLRRKKKTAFKTMDVDAEFIDLRCRADSHSKHGTS